MFVHVVPSKDNDSHAPHNILTHAHKDSSATPSQPGPSRAKKTSPPSSSYRTPAPPIDAMLIASRAELGTGFAVRKNRSLLVRERYSEAGNIAREGPGGHRQGMGREIAEGTFFSLGTGRESILNTQA